MKNFFLALLCIPCLLFGEWDHFFSEDDDLVLLHQVNVLSGNLNFAVQDTVVQGAMPLPILRTYSSTGALERPGNNDLILKLLRGGLFIQGGWSILPHANLFFSLSLRGWQESYVHLAEPSGHSQKYHYVGHRDREYHFRPDKQNTGQTSGRLNGRQDPQNNLIVIPKNQDTATVFLSSGGKRLYRLSKKGTKKHNDKWFCLSEETLPSQHKIHYYYNGEDNLERVALLNPAGNKVLAEYSLEINQQKVPYHFKIRTSDQKELDFQALKHENRDYLRDISNTHGPKYSYSYNHGRKSIGARVQSCEVAGQTKYFYHYYGPTDSRTERAWAKHPTRKDFSCDKVEQVDAPYGPHGEMVPLATFSYVSGCTDVRDIENLLTRYHHHDGILDRVEYFGEHDRHHSSIVLYWKNRRLAAKVVLNEKKIPLFSKTFSYDDSGNVIAEVYWGNLTGRLSQPFTLNPDGSLKGAESYVKKYSYTRNLLEKEEEESGLSYSYSYYPDTDLVVAKITSLQGQIIKREFCHYDSDHLCVLESIDDGSSPQETDLQGVTYRVVKSYERDPHDGKVTSVRHSHWDPSAKAEQLDQQLVRFYRSDQLIAREDVYDAKAIFRYSIHYEYDAAGRITRKSNPLGTYDVYKYDDLGRVVYSKEVGKPEKWITYNVAGYPHSCREVDRTGKETTLLFNYDHKGRLLSQTDQYGNTTSQLYDIFGHCIETHFPKCLDETGQPYTPIVAFSYDTSGNLISTQTPKGEITQTLYNSHRKPYKIIQPDGSEIIHYSTKTGLVEETIYPDGTRAFYTYDPFQQMTSKKISDKDGSVLSHETWDYSPFELRSKTDTLGLTTTYTYDGAGKKVQESSEDRTIEYTYDALGFLETTKQGSERVVEIHDVMGRVVQTWRENDRGDRENVMSFEYDSDHQKRKAYRLTSQGEAIDHFEYDGQGRLSQHTNPLGQTVTFIHNDEWTNELGQNVLQKITIDPLHRRTLETFDAAHRLVCKEKQDSDQKTVFKEEFFYDRSGNLSLRRSHIYEGTRFIKTIESEWAYNSMGLMSDQIEARQKKTHFEYNTRGLCIYKRLPSGIELFFTYDGLGRLLTRKSSDKTIDDIFTYGAGPDPIQATNAVTQQSILRSYNPFGELISEQTTAGHSYQWTYDREGRRTTFTLPDQSSIQYAYVGPHLAAIGRHTSNGRQKYIHCYRSYDPNGHVSEESLIGGQLLQTSYRDLLERPLSQMNPTVQQTVHYSCLGLIQEASNNLFGTTPYEYDALDQLIKEGNLSYQFDSFGRPLNSQVNDLHQIVSTAQAEISYDSDGNPFLRKSKDQTTNYTYDALGRLKALEIPYQRKVFFTYDPFSRLFSKTTSTYSRIFGWSAEETNYYLYDHDFEIGKVTKEGAIVELKILGVGLQGDIGAAIAIELQDTPYIPVHDFQGHVIALLTPDGSVADAYHLTAFGTLLQQTSYLQNPWIFASKRMEEGLVYFGLRFYDPSLGRWLTPDPAGFIDGPNLYLYVLNNPLSRLDLFGLNQEPFRIPEIYVNVNSLEMALRSIKPIPIYGFGEVNGVTVDYFVSCGFFHKLKFTPEELGSNQINLMNHLPELVPKEGAMVSLCLFENGINTKLSEFQKHCHSLANKIPEGTLFVGIYNRTEGLNKDLKRATDMIENKTENFRVINTRQILSSILNSLHKINPDLLTLFSTHSEGGGILTLALEGMTPDQISLCKQHLLVYNIAPAIPTSIDYAFRSINVYSKDDRITKRYGEKYMGLPNYNIDIIPSTSSWSQYSGFYADHAMAGKSYQGDISGRFKRIRNTAGFYSGK